jgi:hypothetical protein
MIRNAVDSLTTGIMSCMLRAIGTSFDVDGFLKESALPADPAFRRGEPRISGHPEGPKRSASGFNVPISDAEIDDQVSAAMDFLNEHEEELRRLGSFPGVEEVCLDFGVRRRAEEGVQSELFPAGLLWRAGALDIDLVVTYVETEGGSGRRRRRGRGRD